MNVRFRPIIWPTPTLFNFFFLLIIIFAVFFILYIYNLFYKNRMQRKNYWLYVLNFALQNDLSNDEISILKSFFDSLSYKNDLTLLYNRKKFYKSLFNYLEKQENISSEIKVKLLDKLFESNNKPKFSIIESLNDINQRELCNINFGEDHHLGRILAIENYDILIRIPKFISYNKKEGIKASIYIYRQYLGGFTIRGKIREFGEEHIEFKYDGSEILMDRDYNLMINKKISFELIPWPKIKLNKINELKKIYRLYSPEVKTIEKIRDDNNVYGISEKISERAIGFHFSDKEDLENYKRAIKNIWEINIKISENFTFNCRGKIIKPPITQTDKKSDLYFFRYIDISEEMHNKLFDFIKENEPKKELLY